LSHNAVSTRFCLSRRDFYCRFLQFGSILYIVKSR
jgi:hypothetical protein